MRVRALGAAVIAVAVVVAVVTGCGGSRRGEPSTGAGAGSAAGALPTGKFAVDATRHFWADGSPVESGGLNYPTDIHVVDVRTRRVRNVTHDERTEYLWSWLPDGKRMLFASVPSDRMKTGPSHIFIVGADGRQRRQLTSGAGEVTPELAPGGDRFLYVGQGAGERGLYVMRVDGTHKKQLVHGRVEPTSVNAPLDSEAHWSPDGRRIAFVRDSEKTSQIFVVAANGGNVRQLTHTRRAWEGSGSPAWSPDGQKIAFIRPSGDLDFVYVMRSDGTAVKRLTSMGYNGGSISWLSKRRIAYKADDDKWRSIDIDGTGQRPVAPPLDEALSPDARWIASATYRASKTHPLSIWVANRDGTGRRLVTRKICCIYGDIKWAPAASTFANAAHNAAITWSSDTVVRSANIDGSGRHILLPWSGDAHDHTYLAWSRDGRALATNLGVSDNSWIVVFRPKTHKLRAVGRRWDGREPTWSPDAKRIAASHDRWRHGFPWASTIEIVSLATNKWTPVTKPRRNWDDFDPAWSPGGRTIAFARRHSGGTPTIYLVDPDGSGLRRLTKGRSPSWSPDSKRLAFVLGRSIYEIRADGRGRKRILGGLRGPFALVRWSPDGRKLLYTSGDDAWIANTDGTHRTHLLHERKGIADVAWRPRA